MADVESCSAFDFVENTREYSPSTVTLNAVYAESSAWFEVSPGVCHGCVLGPGIFLKSVNWIMNCAVQRLPWSYTAGDKTFTGLCFTDAVSLLASMLKIVVFCSVLLKYCTSSHHSLIEYQPDQNPSTSETD